MPASSLHRASLLLSGWAVAAAGLVSAPAAAGLFEAVDLNQDAFVLVAAPIGDGSQAQLNIYEQLNDRRPCYALNGSQPARVDPLLSSFDFTGICGRFIDSNGYSLRIGSTDMGARYRLSVVRRADDNLLLAIPTRADAGPEMVVARTQGPGTTFLQLLFEPGWQLKRRAYEGRNLGHVYLYRADWPAAATPEPRPTAPSEPASDPAPAPRPAPQAERRSRYGPWRVEWSRLQAASEGSYVVPAETDQGRSLYLAVNCPAGMLNVTGESGDWGSWQSPSQDFQRQFVQDLCQAQAS